MSYNTVSKAMPSHTMGKSVAHNTMGESVSNNRMSTMSSVESIGGVMDSSDGGSKGLGLCGGPVLSLVGLGDGLVGDLARTAVDLSRGCSHQASEADEGLQE